MSLKNTVDYARVNHAIREHQGQAFEIIMRELCYNAQAYGAKEIVNFSFKHNGKYYLLVAHDGKPFESLSEMLQASEFNKSGGFGVQGSGMKTSIYPAGGDPLDSELLLHSKNGNEIYTTSLHHITQTGVEISDVSSKWNIVFKLLLQERYDDFNVLYAIRYNKDIVGCTNGSMSNDESNYKFQDITPSFDKDIIYRYYTKLVDLDIGDVVKHNAFKDLNHSLPEMVAFKKFNIKVDNIEFIEYDRKGDKIVTKFSGEIKLDILPNIKTNENENKILIKTSVPNVYKRISEKFAIGNYIRCFHDHILISAVEQGRDSILRANKDPFWFTGLKSAQHLYHELGDVPHKETFTVDKTYLREQLGMSQDIIDECKIWSPVVKISTYLKGLNVHSDLDSIDNFFYTTNHSKIRDFNKLLLSKAREDNSPELQEFFEHIKKLLPEKPEEDFLPVSLDAPRKKQRLAVRVYLTDAEYAKFKDKNTPYPHKIKLGIGSTNQLSSVPVNIQNGIDVHLVDDTGEVISGDVKVYPVGGLYLLKNPSKPDTVYTLITDDYYENTKNGKKYHGSAGHKSGINFYPKRYYDINVSINDTEQLRRLAIEVDTVPTKVYTTPKNPNTNSKGASIKTTDVYADLGDNPRLYVAWHQNHLKLNRKNDVIKRLAKNNKKYEQKFEELYYYIKDIAEDLYLKNDNFIDLYKVNGNTDLESEFGDIKTGYLNYLVHEILKLHPRAKDLWNAGNRQITEVEI